MTIFSDLPGQFRIGPYDFDVMIETNAKNDLGTMSLTDLKITLSPEHPNPIYALDTILHEVIHAISRIQGLRKNDDEERIANTLASGLTQVLRDNPQLVAWINRVLG